MIGNTNTESDDQPSSATTSGVDIDLNVDTEPEPESESESEPEPESNSNESGTTSPDTAPSPDTPDDTTGKPTTDDPATAAADPPDDDPDRDGDSDPDGFDAEVAGDVLNTFLEIPTGLLDEARLIAGPDEVTLVKPDPANVAFARVSLDHDAFETFHSTEFETGLNLNQASEMAGFYDRTDTIQLDVEDASTLTYGGDDLSFNQGLLAPETIQDVPDLPEFDDTTTFTITTEFIEDAIKAADMVSDHLRLTRDADSVTIEADGDTDEVAVDATDDDLITNPDSEFNVLLSLDYMQNIVRGLAGDTVTIEAGNDIPVLFDGDFADGDGSYRFMLAPRIKDGD